MLPQQQKIMMSETSDSLNNLQATIANRRNEKNGRKGTATPVPIIAPTIEKKATKGKKIKTLSQRGDDLSNTYSQVGKAGLS
jgi:urease gamma subunit